MLLISRGEDSEGIGRSVDKARLHFGRQVDEANGRVVLVRHRRESTISEQCNSRRNCADTDRVANASASDVEEDDLGGVQLRHDGSRTGKSDTIRPSADWHGGGENAGRMTLTIRTRAYGVGACIQADCRHEYSKS